MDARTGRLREIAKAMNRRLQVEAEAQLERVDARPPVFADTFIALGLDQPVDEDALGEARLRRKIEALIPKVMKAARTVIPRFATQAHPILFPRPEPATLAYLKARWPGFRFEERPDQFVGDHWVVPFWTNPDPEHWQRSLELANGM